MSKLLINLLTPVQQIDIQKRKNPITADKRNFPGRKNKSISPKLRGLRVALPWESDPLSILHPSWDQAEKF